MKIKWMFLSVVCLVAVQLGAVNLGHATLSYAEAKPNFSLTISPLHLVMPVLELTGEMAVSDRVGVAGILGFGTITSEASAGFSETKFRVWELGASARYYLLGSFTHGMQVGGEVLYMKLTGDFHGSTLSGVGEGLAVGPFLGYKFVAGNGFTFDSQLGLQSMLARAKVSDGTGVGQDDDSEIILMLNLNLGYSF